MISTRRIAASALILGLSSLPTHADYDAAAGFVALRSELGGALPTGAGVKVSLVEAGTDASASPPYLPQNGSGTFAGVDPFGGISFSVKSAASSVSWHAATVASHLASDNVFSALGLASMTPGITQIDCYFAGTFDDTFLAPLPFQRAPIAETSAIQTHAWIGYADNASASIRNDWLRRLDFSISRDRYLCVCGVNNGGSTPDLNAAAYNVLSVGISSGAHSTGPTSTFVDGPGRLKPEIVAPFAATSWATGYIGSAGALLRAQANALANANATKPFLLKAVMLTGATKDEFPTWARTATQPLDATFGAGELNVAHNYHILAGGEQAANASTARPAEAWDVVSVVANGTADYRLSIPRFSYGLELSTTLVWERTLTDPAGGGYNLTPDPLIDFNLSLYRDPVAGGTPILIDSSTSTLYNIEHIARRQLPAGNYRLRITRNGGTTREVADVFGPDLGTSLPRRDQHRPYRMDPGPHLHRDERDRNVESHIEREQRAIPHPPSPDSLRCVNI
jgi:hypothetical protein